MDLFGDLSFSTIMAGLIFGVLGMWLIKQGRKDAHIPWILIGLVLCVYPYFVVNAFLVWGIGLGLLFVAKRMS